MTPVQETLFPGIKPLSPCQQEILEALRRMAAPGDTSDIQRCLAEHDVPRERNVIAKRLTELERLGHVERVGHTFEGRVSRTVWRRKG